MKEIVICQELKSILNERFIHCGCFALRSLGIFPPPSCNCLLFLREPKLWRTMPGVVQEDRLCKMGPRLSSHCLVGKRDTVLAGGQGGHGVSNCHRFLWRWPGKTENGLTGVVIWKQGRNKVDRDSRNGWILLGCTDTLQQGNEKWMTVNK